MLTFASLSQGSPAHFVFRPSSMNDTHIGSKAAIPGGGGLSCSAKKTEMSLRAANTPGRMAVNTQFKRLDPYRRDQIPRQYSFN